MALAVKTPPEGDFFPGPIFSKIMYDAVGDIESYLV